jgi:hypothetical protein
VNHRLAFAADSSEKTVMSFTGTVKGGVVVLPPGVSLPEGLEVQLTVPDSASPEEAFVLHETASPFPTVDGLPDDRHQSRLLPAWPPETAAPARAVDSRGQADVGIDAAGGGGLHGKTARLRGGNRKPSG